MLNNPCGLHIPTLCTARESPLVIKAEFVNYKRLGPRFFVFFFFHLLGILLPIFLSPLSSRASWTRKMSCIEPPRLLGNVLTIISSPLVGRHMRDPSEIEILCLK